MAGKLTGIEIFANVAAATVKYSILGLHCVCGVIAHIGNRIKEWTSEKQRERSSCSKD